MATLPPLGEEMARAMPFSFFIGEGIVIMLAAKIYREIGEGDPVSLLSIALGFFYFTNQAGLHDTPRNVY